MEPVEISSIREKRQHPVLKRLAMFFVAVFFCILSTASSSWMSTKGVLAVGGVPVILHEFTKADIEDAKNRRDEAIRKGMSSGISIRQLSRLTGVSKAVIEKIKRGM